MTLRIPRRFYKRTGEGRVLRWPEEWIRWCVWCGTCFMTREDNVDFCTGRCERAKRAYDSIGTEQQRA